MNKFFNGRKYFLEPKDNWWFRTTFPYIHLSHDVWNYYYPNDPILEDEVIHHKNGNKSDDRIENLRKMKRGNHQSMHMTGNQYSLGNRNNLGKHRTDETKQKMSDAISGNKHWNFGKHHTDETKQKMRDTRMSNKKSNMKEIKRNEPKSRLRT